MGIWQQRLGHAPQAWLWPAWAAEWAGMLCAVLSALFLAALAGLWLVSGLRISVIDVREHRIPRAIVLPARLWSLLLIAALSLLLHQPAILCSAVVGGLGYWLLLYALHRAHPGGLGRGDVNYASLLGLITGATGWAHPWAAAAAGLVLGGLWAMILVLLRRAGPRTHLPYGPFMFAGSLAVMLLT